MTAASPLLAVVVNPVGAADQAEIVAGRVQEWGADVLWFETTEDDPGAGQAQEAIDKGADVIAVCGGDGTVRSCVESLAGTDRALAVIPAGTGNLLARNLNIPTDPAAALEVALGAGRRRIDVGYANGEAFAVMAGAGLDAAIMRDTSREAKDRFGSLAYVKTALEHLRDPRVRCIATVAGRPVFSGPIASVLAANHGRLQAGVDLFPGSAPDDGSLDLMVLRATSISGWIESALAIATDREPPELIKRWSGGTADITFATATPYEIDGEERPPTGRLTFRIDHQALTVCVPEEMS